MKTKQIIDQTRKARVGAIGENLVVAKLMPQNNDRATREKLSKIINKIIIKIYFV